MKIHCDLNRICQIEDSAAEWYTPEAYTFYPLFNLGFLDPLFTVIDLKYTGVEGRICKCHLQATHPGFLDSPHLRGFKIRVINNAKTVSNEVKRIGFFHDRDISLELRVGDRLTIFISEAIA